MSLSLISVNIERAKHYDRLLPFLLREKPDVVCFQELYERDILFFERELGGKIFFTPLGNHPTDPPEERVAVMGIGVITTLPAHNQQQDYYAGSSEEARSSPMSTVPSNRAICSIDIKKDEAVYTIATTHFTWTPDGRPDDTQRKDLRSLQAILDSKKEFVLTGDFNAPRGTEIFDSLAKDYTDNIPVKYTTSIDGSLHRAGPLPYMVDGLFSTPEYQVHDVRLESGVSDHCAIIALIARNP